MRQNPNYKCAAIIRAIKNWVKDHSFLWVDYSNWYVGITGDPSGRKSRHNSDNLFNVGSWKSWDAESYSNARAIEKYFGGDGKGMYGGIVKGGANRRSKYVYVYK